MQRYMNQVYRRIALDRILVGWHGTSAATETDPSSNENLEDVNKGWLHLLKTNKPEHYLTEGTASSGKIKVGKNADYNNLDSLVYDVLSMIPDAQRTGNEVAIIGRQQVARDMAKALSQYGQQPTEKIW